VPQRFDDAYLVGRAQEGRLDAFEALVVRHQERIYRVALRMLGNQHDAQDAAQDTFLQAWKALPRFRADSTFSTWLYRIATNQCLDMLRTRRHAEPLEDRPGKHTSRPDVIVEGRAKLALVQAAIGRLTPEQRAPLVLREFEGCSYDEIASILDISIPAVKGRIHRARLDLLEAMHEWA
jgi:RNA polymerase sigma-70 factor, ECF subfamily